MVWDQDGFAVASGYDEATGRYVGLAIPQENVPPQITDSTLLVNPTARSPSVRRSGPNRKPPGARPPRGGSTDGTDRPDAGSWTADRIRRW